MIWSKHTHREHPRVRAAVSYEGISKQRLLHWRKILYECASNNGNLKINENSYSVLTWDVCLLINVVVHVVDPTIRISKTYHYELLSYYCFYRCGRIVRTVPSSYPIAWYTNCFPLPPTPLMPDSKTLLSQSLYRITEKWLDDIALYKWS